jgi:hypothetical protein
VHQRDAVKEADSARKLAKNVNIFFVSCLDAIICIIIPVMSARNGSTVILILTFGKILRDSTISSAKGVGNPLANSRILLAVLLQRLIF